MKFFYCAFIIVAIIGISSCRKPRQGDFQMVLSGETATTTTDSSGVTESIKQYSDSYTVHIEKSKKTSVEVGNMTWSRSGDNVSFTSTNVNLNVVISGNWPGGGTETIVETYNGIIKSNNSIEGNFVFTHTKVNNQTEEVEATTGTFTLHRK